MFKIHLSKSVISAVIVVSGGFSSSVHADLGPSVLQGIIDGTRVNTKVQVPLNQVPIPEPSNLYEFVKDKQKAIELGKALFWDMQVGSDGIQACASCHFNAGADSRTKNQLSPGVLISSLNQVTGELSSAADKTFEAGKGANYQLSSADYPHRKLTDPNLFTSAELSTITNTVSLFSSDVVRDTNDVTSSQGVHYTEFQSATTGEVIDETKVVPDEDGFQVGGINTRRVEPRNTPTMVNAVFNHRNFWDGRATETFNGVNNMGDNDPYAFVYQKDVSTGELIAVNISIDHASLASQAMDPPTSKFEMSADGRTWQEIGDNLVGKPSASVRELGRTRGKRVKKLRPLATQMVDPTDSVLGRLSAAPRPGLKVRSYNKMIRNAFKPQWWSSKSFVRINEDGSRTIVNKKLEDNDYSQMEMNFSLFFGLAVQLYQATLVSDQTPFDFWVAGDDSALTDQEKIGFFIAHDEARCLNCHGGPELTFASVTQIEGLTINGAEIVPAQGITRARRNNLIDEGFNNIGVRPTLEDLGVGGTNVNNLALSYGRRLRLGETAFSNPNVDPVKEANLALGADGAFKIPGLRNVELTAPYFHNGGESTLEDVVDFYFRGGNFRKYAPTKLTDCASSIAPDQARLIDHPVQGFNSDRTEEVIITGLGILRGPLANSGPGAKTHPVGDCIANDGFSEDGVNPNDGLDEADRANIVAWLKSLTDQRVVNRSAPFDHPQLFVPSGHPDDHVVVIDDGSGLAVDSTLIEIPATGAAGVPEVLPTFEQNLAP